MPLFSNAEAEELLTRLAAKGGASFTVPSRKFLLELAGPHPLLLQIAGFHAFELSTATDITLDETAYQQVRHCFLVEAEPHWTYFWHRRLPQDQKILALLPIVWRSDLTAVRRLEQAGLVRQREDKIIYLSPAFRDFIRQQDVPGLLQAPPVTLDPEQHLALLRDCALSLSPTEFALLLCLVRHAGQLVPHHELEAQVWPDAYIEDPELLKTTLRNLRRVLGEDADCIQNVRGIGYKFVGH